MAKKTGTPTKTERYRMVLRSMDQWEPFLKAQAGLPGPRGNLELVQAVVDVAAPDRIWAYQALTPEQAPENTPDVILAVAGTVGLGRLAAEGDAQALPRLRFLANDPRWRMREAVAMALQRLGDADMDRLLREMETWSEGTFLEMRAVMAGLCEPRLLENPQHTRRVYDVLDRITQSIEQAGDRGEDFKILRQGLAYGWSVAAVALPEEGKRRMERWMQSADRDVLWLMKENLKKNRLVKMDTEWVETWRRRLEG